MAGPKEIWIVRYETKYGVEVYPAIVKKKDPPELTNRLLRKVGVADPELEKSDEAEWIGPFILKDLPKVIGPREWHPEADLAIAILMVYSSDFENVAIIPAWVLPDVEAPDVTTGMLEELDPFIDEEDVDFDKTEWIGPDRIEKLPVV